MSLVDSRFVQRVIEEVLGTIILVIQEFTQGKLVQSSPYIVDYTHRSLVQWIKHSLYAIDI